MAPTEDQAWAHSPGCTRRTEERSDWNCRVIGAVFPDGVGPLLHLAHSGPQRPADTCGREIGLTENRQEGGVVGGREETKSVCQSVCLPTSHGPPAPRGAELHGQVELLDQLNHHIYSNCSVIVPKEPGSNELDIIKILMPSFPS